MKKVILTGPESSGKTTLSKQLAAHFQTIWVPEYARTYLKQLHRPYSQEDLYLIAQGQLATEQQHALLKPPFLICDTSFLVLKIWSIYKYGSCHPFILEQIEKTKSDMYLLCQPDMPWEADPLRENPNDRSALYQLYLEELKKLGAHFVELQGNPIERLTHSTNAILKYT